MQRILMAALTVALIGVAAGAATEPAWKVTRPAPPGMGQKLSFGFTKIVVSDMDRAMKYYTAIGMKEAQRYTTPSLLEINMKFDDADATLVLQKYSDNRKIELGTAYGNLGIVTPDIRGLYAKLDAIGFTPKAQPREMADLGISVGMAEDPDGHPLEIVQILKK